MKDILEKAKFGDKFLTRDGSMAIFWGSAPLSDGYYIITEHSQYSMAVFYDKYGKCEVNRCEHLDIVAPWN